MKHIIPIIALGLIFISSCNRTRNEDKVGRWYKGNLHTHSYWSDGDDFPEMIMDWYKSHGYHFVSLSDHNILAEGEKWKEIQPLQIYQRAFDNYLNKYGKEWVRYETDSTGTKVLLKTYQEYEPLFVEDGRFLILKGEEITDSYEGNPIHINATNIQSLIEPAGGTSVADVMQNNLDQVLKQREETGIAIMPHINHPNFGWAITTEDMIQLRGERFFEVYNGHPAVRNYGDSIRPGTEEMWDLINIAYVQRGQPLMYGIATDDSHYFHLFGKEYSNAGRGWVMVQSESLEAELLIEAMEAGNFYASTGVELMEIKYQDSKITIEIKEEEGTTYRTIFIGVKNGETKADTLAEIPGYRAEFQVTDDLLFVRAKVISDQVQENPFQDGDFESAWIQPTLGKKN